MRKQNSVFKTKFISEAGSELGNHDYFAFVELEKYACYVLADGLNDLPDGGSAKMAAHAIILAFQEHPSMGKRAVRTFLEAANKALAGADSRERLKASVMVVVSDYARIRYGCAGNTRLRLYRDGAVKEQSRDMSLGMDLTREQKLAQDVLARHEERNNLYAYVGQGAGFVPFISPKTKLENGDILALYTRGIWENLDGGELDDVFSEAKDDPQKSLDQVEDLLLSRQPERLENYTFATIFVDKVFSDPNRKRRIKKIVVTGLIALAVVLVAVLVLWFLSCRRKKQLQEMEQHYGNVIEYIQDANFVRAGEECQEALKLAEKLRRKKETRELSDYQKLIEAVSGAEELFESGDYREAQSSYVAAKERSRYADRLADAYIDKKLSAITDYLSVFDYIELGDRLAAQGEYERAEEKYLQARSLATKSYFEEGRQDALDCLDALYESRGKAEEARKQEAIEKASNETGAAGLASEGDKAFAEGDYEGARAYYAMALEKYQELGDTAHGELIQEKIRSSGQKSEENKEKEKQAEAYLEAGREQEAAGERLEAKKQYLMAKNLYRELKKDEKVLETDGRIEVLEAALELEKAEEETKGVGENEEEAKGARENGEEAKGMGENGEEAKGTGENGEEAKGAGENREGTKGVGENREGTKGAGENGEEVKGAGTKGPGENGEEVKGAGTKGPGENGEETKGVRAKWEDEKGEGEKKEGSRNENRDIGRAGSEKELVSEGGKEKIRVGIGPGQAASEDSRDNGPGREEREEN